MKKLSIVILTTAASLCLFSCSKENNGPALSKISFRVTAENPVDPYQTSASLNEADGSVSFTTGEQISVFDGVGNQPFQAASSGTTVTFDGSAASAATYNILSPYQAEATISGNVITATVPKVQTAVLGGVDPAALISVGRTTDTGDIHLKNVVGLLKVTVNTANAVHEIQVAAGAALNEPIAGQIDITVPSAPDATPTYTVADTTPEGKVTCVTLVPPAGENFLEVGTYYIAVLPKTYDGLTVGFVTAEKFLRARTGNAAAAVTRSGILPLGALGNGYGEGYSNISTTGNAILLSGDQVNLRMKQMATPSVTAFSQDENTITKIEIKVNTLDGAAATTTLHNSGAANVYPVYAILRGTVLTLYTRDNNIKLAGSQGGGAVFRNFAALESINAEVIAAGNATVLTRLFANCPKLEEVDLSGLNTTNITTMNRVFENCTNLKKINLSGWSTANVTGSGADTGFYLMFAECQNLEDLNLGISFMPGDGVYLNGMFQNTARQTSIDFNNGIRTDKCKLQCLLGCYNFLKASENAACQFNAARFDFFAVAP